MATNAANTEISYDSKLTRLPDDATWPTALTTPLTGGIDYGFTQEDGETLSKSVSTEVRRAHQKRAVVRTLVTDSTCTLAVTFLENKKDVRELYWAAEETDGVMDVEPGQTVTGTFVYDTFDSEDGFVKATRYVFRANATSNGDIVYAPGELTTYPVLFTTEGKVRIISSTEED